jgi:hypothetical protein
VLYRRWEVYTPGGTLLLDLEYNATRLMNDRIISRQVGDAMSTRDKCHRGVTLLLIRAMQGRHVVWEPPGYAGVRLPDVKEWDKGWVRASPSVSHDVR